MGTLVDNDIDSFIRGHKAKLQQERANINEYTDQRQPQQGRQQPSPSNRRQWDRGQRSQPAVQNGQPAQPEETGLRFGDSDQQKRQQQLKSERQQEYNDIINNKNGARTTRRRQRTPSQEGLPLGHYDQKRKAIDRQRQQDMQKAMEAKKSGKQSKSNMFDYTETEKAHMAEKRMEYNDYLEKKKQESRRHIITPEDGMFVGPDQTERDKQIREKSRANRLALEKQQREQLLFKARQQGHIPPHSNRNTVMPRQVNYEDVSPRRAAEEPSTNQRPPIPYIQHQQGSYGQDDDTVMPRQIVSYEAENRARGGPNVGSRPVAGAPVTNQRQSREVRFNQNDVSDKSPRQVPIYMEHGSDVPVIERREDKYAGRVGHDNDRGRARDRTDRQPDRRHRSQDRGERAEYERKLSSPLEVRKSRSLSPPHDRLIVNPEAERLVQEQRKMLEDLKKNIPKQRASWDKSGAPNQDPSRYADPVSYKVKQQENAKRMYEEQMAERQQILETEYRREVAEENRIAAERDRNGLPFQESNRQQLDDERKREYQEYLAKATPRTLRAKEPTPEHLRRGLPLDQRQHDVKKRQLDSERQREYNEFVKKQQQQQRSQPPPQSRGQGRSRNVSSAPQNGQFDDADQRQQYYRRQYDSPDYSEKASQGGNRQTDVLQGSGATLPVGEYDDERKQHLVHERQREYNEQQQQKMATARNKGLPPKPPTPNHFFKNIGQHDRTAQMLNEERKKEYNQKLQEDRGRTAGRVPDGQEEYGGGLSLKGADSAEVKLGKQEYATLPGLHYSNSADGRKIKTRNAEYNEFLREKQWKDAHRMDSKKPPNSITGRHSEPSSPRGKNKDTYGTLPGLHYSDSADKRKIQERNREYNEHLKQKQGRGKKGWATPTYEEILDQKRREELGRQENDYGSSNMRRYASEGAINNLQNDYRSHELDKEFEARKVRFDDERRSQGGILEDDNWLQQQQQQQPERREDQYQQLVEPPPRDDMALRVGQPGYMASLPVGAGAAPGLGAGHDDSASAKKRRQSDYRRELQLQMEESKAARKREKVQGLRVNASGLVDPEKSSFRVKGLEGPIGVSPRREYKANDVQPYHTKFLLDDSEDHDAIGRSRGQATRTAPMETGARVARAQDLGLGNLNPLGLGSNTQAYPVERQHHPLSAPPLKGILNRGDIDNSRNAPPSPKSLSDFGDDLRLDLGGGGGGGGRERGRRRERDTGLIDPGFAGILESRRNVGVANPPPGLMYQPSTYVTGGNGGLAGPYSSIDEAYHYTGMKNPLEIDSGNGGGGRGGGGGGGGGLGLNLDYGGGQIRGSPTPRVTFADDPPLSTRRRDRSKERISPYQFVASEEEVRSRSRTDTQSYGAELERQIQEKRMQKMREKQDQERYERKLEEDIKNYNPFGRGGGGAPIRDGTGNAVADLRSLQRGGNYQSPRQPPSVRQLSPEYSPRAAPRDDLIGPPPAQATATGESTYARGGHGIFGQPKTEAEKDQSDKYKDDLREQIAEKRRREQMEKDKERQEEERENKRLEDQRIRMQTEYEEEQRKIRAREDEARRKNEEMKKAADDRKKETERKRREADDARMRDQQEQIDREKREQQQRENADRERLKSPPVPAVKAKPGHSSNINMTIYQTTDDRGSSPPLPAQRRGDSPPLPAQRREPSAVSIKSHRSNVQPSPAQDTTSNRPNSSDVLTQLASMRKQLQSERRRVETALENQSNQPDVFDPRTIQRPPPNKLIFENAVNKNASNAPPRPITNNNIDDRVNSRNLQQFNELKFKADTRSRQQFRSMFPDAPVTNTTLEAQQDAMLRQQEDQLRALRDRTPDERADRTQSSLSDLYDPTPSNNYIRRPGNISARSQLASNSAFIDVEGLNHFPEDFDDMAGVRNNSARARRRAGYSPSPRTPSGMGSQASLDVERIQRKNDERLRKLNQMGGDDVSMGDPDDILDRFMAKQRYNRPPSGRTLNDDSWLRPGSKVL